LLNLENSFINFKESLNKNLGTPALYRKNRF